MDLAPQLGRCRSTVMSMAKAIAITEDKTQRLMAFATASLGAVIVLVLVSLIEGVVRPMIVEW